MTAPSYDPVRTVPDRVPAWAPRFGEDCGRAWRVWRRYPLLPVLTVVLGVLPVLVGSGGQPRTAPDGSSVVEPATGAAAGAGTLVSLLLLLTLGFPGAQRLWYARAWHGEQVEPAQVASWTVRQFGRWCVLGLAVGGVALLLAVPALVPLVRDLEVRPDGTVVQPPTPFLLSAYLVGVVVVLDVLLTFVTPALVFTSHRVRDAVRIGLRLLVRTWPGAAAYALVPPLAVVLASLWTGLPREVSVPLVALSTLANLLVKGATAALYLRTMPMVGPLGAMSLRSEDVRLPPRGLDR